MLAETRRCCCSARQGGRECWVSSISRPLMLCLLSAVGGLRQEAILTVEGLTGTMSLMFVAAAWAGHDHLASYLRCCGNSAGSPLTCNQHVHCQSRSCCCPEPVHLRSSRFGFVSLQSSDRPLGHFAHWRL
ncbi:hypothetical protein CKAH01_09007 [Colletotrichum kahawae]|uniref:Uncharacterized protein n=1 Tax=Colletotrichum kahawae TaxID=34407 RepID=A0AAD9XZH9_COLKA|nr:hypothetical protein CKAH01_09007 [Colletotrichum kahawae]